MVRLSRRSGLIGPVILLLATACTDSDCGGCVTPLEEPFPDEPRVYDGAQMRVTPAGFDFIEDNLVVIVESLLEDGLTFEVPPSDFEYLGVDGTICATPCPVEVEILDTALTLEPPAVVRVDAHANVTGTVTMDADLFGSNQHCDIPLDLQNKPVTAEVMLQVDPTSHFVIFDVTEVDVTIEDKDYELECPAWFDWLLEWLKGFITGILNSQMQGELNQAIDDLVAEQTCLGCDFYSGGCPTGSSCQDDYCTSGGACLIKPLGVAGILDLGEQLASVDPDLEARVDMLIALGQAQQPGQRPFVRNQGLEMRLIGGTFAERDGCNPVPDPAEVPPAGLAPPMLFDDLVPGSGASYMVGVAVADMYLDHFLYHLWRSGMLCLQIDSYGVEQISSGTLALFIPSLDLLTDGDNAPVRIGLSAQRVPFMEVGAGTFLPDGSIDEPILTMFLPRLAMDFWVKTQGRWVRFLSLTQDVEVRLGLEFTAENQVVPILDDDSVVVTNPHATDYELLAEDPAALEQLVPQLIGMFLPMLTDTMGDIEIPDLQGFVLDIKSLQGDLRRAGTPWYEFMSIYADLSFTPPPPAVETRVRLYAGETGGAVLENLAPGTAVQFRIDGGVWSPFRPGPFVELPAPLLPGRHLLEVRARRQGAYRTLDPTPAAFDFETLPVRALLGTTGTPAGAADASLGAPAGPGPIDGQAGKAPRGGCAQVPGEGSPCTWFLLLVLALPVLRAWRS